MSSAGGPPMDPSEPRTFFARGVAPPTARRKFDDPPVRISRPSPARRTYLHLHGNRGAGASDFRSRARLSHHRGERPWPSGLITHEETNGLMLGNAGIGHIYLRLSDPALRSLLAPTPFRQRQEVAALAVPA